MLPLSGDDNQDLVLLPVEETIETASDSPFLLT